MGQAVLQPAAASLEACSYSLAGLGACSDACAGAAARAAAHVRAGDPVMLAVSTRDRLGNAVPVAPGAIMAAANGPRAPCRLLRRRYAFCRQKLQGTGKGRSQ